MLARYYDLLADWPRRLAREIPFLRRLLPGRRILVAGCGTGGHLPALLAAGYDVTGIDSDASMVDVARARGEGRVHHLSIERCSSLGSVFDAVLCLGNVLPGLSVRGQLEAALAEIHAVLAPGGVFFTQNLNYDLRWRQKNRFFPLLSGRHGEEEIVLFKFADYAGSHLDFHTVFLVRPDPAAAWEQTILTTRQRPVFRQDLENACRLAGFSRLESWGGYAGEPFDPNRSHDLLLAAWK